MTWTYGADPVNDPVDEVHFLVGDTDNTDPLLQNEEIELFLAMYPKPTGKPAYLAGAAAADAIAAKYARNMNSSVGPLSQQAEQQFLHYQTLASQLRLMWATSGEGTGNQSLRIAAGAPVLGGGGRLVVPREQDVGAAHGVEERHVGRTRSA